MNLYDSHIHLNNFENGGFLDKVLSDFIDSGGKSLLAVSIDLQSIQDLLRIYKDLAQENKKILKIAIGIHPECFAKHTELPNRIEDINTLKQTISLLDSIIKHNKQIINAIGETGLDYKWIRQDIELKIEEFELFTQLQKLSFKNHIELALKYDLPMSIHVRDTDNSNDAVVDLLKILAQEGKGLIKGVIHSYTSDIKFLSEILSLGLGIGINGIITYKSGENIRQIAKEVPDSAIFIETDGPLLPPESKRKKKYKGPRISEPRDVYEIAEKIAEVRGVSVEQILKINEENYKRVFS